MIWEDKVVLLTGGTGSFGTNFLKYFLTKYTPKQIRVYSRDEFKQTNLLEQYKNERINGLIGDIRDLQRLKRAMKGVDIVIHAAALKQVQSCEYNTFETIKTNILGSMNIVDAALDCDIEKVLAISTDKAVFPINLYGATKMCMEKIIIGGNNYRGRGRTKFSCVRYGNVACSRGSVIPKWRELRIKKEPIPITNPQSTRFWLEFQQAVQFVINSLELMEQFDGGEIFIPIIPSVNIMDLYHAFSTPDCSLMIVGNRMGDKLHESLISIDEVKHTIERDNRFIICPENPKWKYSKPIGERCDYYEGYRSDNNRWFLKVDEIKKRLEENP